MGGYLNYQLPYDVYFHGLQHSRRGISVAEIAIFLFQQSLGLIVVVSTIYRQMSSVLSSIHVCLGKDIE